jgi:hypothetical protein
VCCFTLITAAEERSTTPQDAAALDAADASAGTSGGGTRSSSSSVAAGMPYDRPGPAVLGLAAAMEVAALQQPAAAAPSEHQQHLQQGQGHHHQQQQQQEEDYREEQQQGPSDAVGTTTSSRLSSSARSALTVLGGQVTAVPGHMALLLDLQRRWAGYQIGRMGRAAQDSFSTASQVVSGVGVGLWVGDWGVAWQRTRCENCRDCAMYAPSVVSCRALVSPDVLALSLPVPPHLPPPRTGVQLRLASSGL